MSFKKYRSGRLGGGTDDRLRILSWTNKPWGFASHLGTFSNAEMDIRINRSPKGFR